MVVDFEICPHCGRKVKMNGIGSTNGFWQKALKATLGRINPITVRLFDLPSRGHDMAYHQCDIHGIGLHEAQKDSDSEFLEHCLLMVENPENALYRVLKKNESGDLAWSSAPLGQFNIWTVKANRWYFRHKAKQYHWALERGGKAQYGAKNKLPCTDPGRIFLDDDIYDD